MRTAAKRIDKIQEYLQKKQLGQTAAKGVSNEEYYRRGMETLGQALAKIETGADLPAGSLPRSPDEAAAMGFESMAEATAAALGLTPAELKTRLRP